MPESKIGTFYNQDIHYSVGAVIERDGKYLLIDRAKPPFGFAGIAGHVDDDEEPEQALVREVMEESGLKALSHKLLFAEFVEWNECSRGMRGHYWYVYACTTDGAVHIDQAEEKSIGWYSVSEVQGLALEPVWGHWFKKLNLL